MAEYKWASCLKVRYLHTTMQDRLLMFCMETLKERSTKPLQEFATGITHLTQHAFHTFYGTANKEELLGDKCKCSHILCPE
jgi:hypothetical protein